MNPIEFAAHQTAHGLHRGDLPEMAKYLGMGEQVLRNKVNPEQEAKLSLDEAVRMMRKSGDMRILEAIAADFGMSLSKPVIGSPKALMTAMIDAAAEHGDVMRAVADGVADGRWTLAEVAEVRKQIMEERGALDRLEQAVLAEILP